LISRSSCGCRRMPIARFSMCRETGAFATTFTNLPPERLERAKRSQQRLGHLAERIKK
jgi:hypothetical protein